MHTVYEPSPAWVAPAPLAARADAATKVYGKGDTEVRALDDVTVGLPAGRFTAIMGPSGSGKSTLMHCLAGLDTLTSGHVFVRTRRRDRPRRTHRPAAHPRPPRADRVRLPGVQPAADADREGEHHAADGPRRPRARQGVGRSSSSTPSGWIDRLQHRPSELSGGQQQRVAVARALAVQAGVDLRRRADRQPRQPHRRRDPRLHAPAPSTSSVRRS